MTEDNMLISHTLLIEKQDLVEALPFLNDFNAYMSLHVSFDTVDMLTQEEVEMILEELKLALRINLETILSNELQKTDS